MKTFVSLISLLILTTTAYSAKMPTKKQFTKSFGMKFVKIEPASFAMGKSNNPIPKVLHGTSHGTFAYYSRSANRMGTLPEDKHWLIGFRVVIGKMPEKKHLVLPDPPLNQRDVVQRDPKSALLTPDPTKPYFEGPKRFVKIHRNPDGSKQLEPLRVQHQMARNSTTGKTG